MGPAFFLAVTHPFEYRAAVSLEHAVKELAEPGAVPLGGGTDLLVAIEEKLTAPKTLVDLRTIPGSADVQSLAPRRHTVWRARFCSPRV